MSYQTDCDKADADRKEAHRLYEVWQASNKDEDREIWFKALSNVRHRKYLTVQLTVWPSEDMDAEKLKEMIESQGVSLPWLNQEVYHGDKVVAEIVSARASVWPKKSI